MFGCLLGPGSFDSPEKPFACKQVSFPITFGGVKPISTSTIMSPTYFGSGAFVVLIIVVRFMVDQPFLF